MRLTLTKPKIVLRKEFGFEFGSLGLSNRNFHFIHYKKGPFLGKNGNVLCYKKSFIRCHFFYKILRGYRKLYPLTI